jgi:DNA recombination-dependent growth factor C
MAFFSSSVAFTRYRVESVETGGFWQYALERINTLGFRDSVAGLEEDNYGWCSMFDPYSYDITMDDISFGEFLLVAIRIEQRKVPASVVKKYCLLEEKKLMAERDIQRLPSRIRKEIRDRVRFELLAKAIPVPRIFELLWDTGNGDVLLFSCQDRSREVAEDLFYRTFETRLQPVIPYTLAEDFAVSEGLSGNLEKIRAEVLA